jgi:hypothetical protein
MNDDTSPGLDVRLPGSIADKCLRLEAPGEGLTRVMITIPSIVRPGQPFGATVSLLDANAMPLIAQGEEVTLSVGAMGVVPKFKL